MTAYDREYFEALYYRDPDPWRFETSPYEQAKYAATLACLPHEHYRQGLELGCSIGVLTEKLIHRVDSLTAVDTSALALARAQQRLEGKAHVRWIRAHLPDGHWQGEYDLVFLSEVLYYLDHDALRVLGERLSDYTVAGASILAVHWTGPTDYPLTAQAAVDGFEHALSQMHCVLRQSTDHYRIDLWQRN
jgi:trans-aconitate methyltransferase